MRVLAAGELGDLPPVDGEVDPYSGGGPPRRSTPMDKHVGLYRSRPGEPIANGGAPPARRTSQLLPGFNTPKGDFHLPDHE